MKTNLLVLLFFVVLSFIANQACAQSYTMKNDQIVKTEKSVKTKAPDKVYTVQDGITFYVGSKGGIYYWKTSKKTGKTYKVYVKNESAK